MEPSKCWLRNFFRLRLHPWGVITAAGMLACIGTFLGFLGSYNWVLDLFSHFRVQYFLGLCLATSLLLIPKHNKTSAVFAVMAVMNLLLIAPLYVCGENLDPKSMTVMRAVLANVNTAGGSAERIGQVIREENPDLIVLEEVSDRWIENLQSVTQSYPYSKVKPRQDNFGIALYSRLPLKGAEEIHLGIAEVPSLAAWVETGGGDLTVIAVHTLPPSGKHYSELRNEQLAAIPPLVREATAPVLLLGDLNVSPWSPYFRRLLGKSGLKDSSQGRGVQPTWPVDRPFYLIPIDHCLYSEGVVVVDKRIGPDVGSDHYPIIVDFALRYDLRHWLGTLF